MSPALRQLDALVQLGTDENRDAILRPSPEHDYFSYEPAQCERFSDERVSNTGFCSNLKKPYTGA